MSKQIEIERKFVLDLPRRGEIFNDVLLETARKVSIRQCYVSNGKKFKRYRKEGHTYVRESKTSLKIEGVPYSASIERSTMISREEFEEQWKKSKKRVTKDRYILHETTSENHNIVVDEFHTENGTPYALIAEVETIWDHTTTHLDLNLRLPSSLHKYVIWEVDKSDPASKMFSSVNMYDDKEVITGLQNFIKELR